MQIFRSAAALPDSVAGGVFAIGNFDGLHRGHQAVLARTRAIAQSLAAPFGVMTFEPHPRQYFAPAAAPFRLTPFRSKMHRLQALSVDLAVVLHFDAHLAGMTAEAFVEDLMARGLKARHIVAGYDFVYGHKRRGNAATLVEAGARLGFEVTITPAEFAEDGVPYSSTEIRERLKNGRPEDAARLLGHPWEIEGRVEPGAQLGRDLGFPTANLPLGEYLRPASGIYAVRVGIEAAGGVFWHDGVGYIGTRPAVGGTTLALEVNLFEFSGDLYGRHLRVQLIGWIRPDRNFGGLAELTAQIALDATAARQLLAAKAHSDD